MASFILTDNSILVYRFAERRGLIPFGQNIQARWLCARDNACSFFGQSRSEGNPRFQLQASDSGSGIVRLDKTSPCARFASGWAPLRPCETGVWSLL